jgi:hypothetical protein
MTDVKLVVSEKAFEQIPLRNPVYNMERYSVFIDVFGEGEFGLVSSPSLERELLTGVPCETAVLGRDLEVISTEEGIACRLLLASTFKREDKSPMGFEEIRRILGYLESQMDGGNIGNMVNSGEATLNEDKLSILDIGREGFRIPLTSHFRSFDDFAHFVHSNQGDYVLKHRFGEEGKQVLSVNSQNTDFFRTYKIGDYILQQELDIENEKRLIFFDDEFLASRVIHDRTRPWEDREIAGRRHSVERYEPSDEEITDTLKALQLLGSTLGCIDWVTTKDGKRYFLEFNGMGTGLGYTGGPYNLLSTVAEKLKEKYLD